jgi:hypothetical protein
MWHVLPPPGVRGRVVRGSHTLPSIADLTLDGSR